MASELSLNLSNLVRNLLNDERSMENETGVVVIVGGKGQVTPIILTLVELDNNNYSPNSLPAQSRKVSFCFNSAIIHADLGLFRYFGI